jgi:hypothetical protein
MDLEQRLRSLGVGVPELLLPGPGVDPVKWAVIACDQYTQDREYWERLDAATGAAPSTLRLIYPEVYLQDPRRTERIEAIHRCMKDYLRGGVFAPPRRALVYLQRATPWRPLRRGLVLAVDLERYDWSPEARPLIRSTEGTVPERLPPRMEIRRGAALESPHIILLVDDEEDALLPALGRMAKTPLYDTALEPSAGRLASWALGEDAWETLASGLERLSLRARTRYGASGGDPFLFAVGDGNHSLATAKAVWEEYKAAHAGEGLEDHPARWALAELENLYDPGIAFEPIHRVLSGPLPPGEILALLKERLRRELPGFSARPVSGPAELSRLVGDAGAEGSRLGLIAGGEALLTETSRGGLATGYLQPLLDAFIAEAGFPLEIDYIHGEEELFRLAGGALGILLPPIRKAGLFETVARSGPLPRKSFSMGEAPEKRFYFECRRLFAG